MEAIDFNKNLSRLNFGVTRCVEPKKRMVAGRFGWAMHRFPIVGGITVFDAAKKDLAASVNRPSALLRFPLVSPEGMGK
jgi:hypothetical protein